MAVIEPVPQKKYSAGLRAWHWLNAIVISGSLLTVLINSTLLDRQIVTPVIKNELSGLALSDQQAGGVGHALEDKVWEIHAYFGYVLAGLLLFRLVLEYAQLSDRRLIRKIQYAYKQFQLTKANRENRHELVVKSLYAAFYLLLVVMVLTGLFLAFEDMLVSYKSIRHSVKEVHGFCMYLVLAFIVVHLAGVFLAERKNGKGIVSDMINGGSE